MLIRFLKENDLIGCGGDPQPIRLKGAHRGVCRGANRVACRAGHRGICRGACRGACRCEHRG